MTAVVNTMNKRGVIGALVLGGLPALIGPAKATELPKEILGIWCSSASPSEDEPFGLSNDGRSCRNQGPYGGGAAIMLTIRPQQYTVLYSPTEAPAKRYTYTCSYIAVATRFDRSIIASTKEMGVFVAKTTANCKNERCTWQEQGRFYVSKGDLYVEQDASVRKGNERCMRAG
jgi:hypothetical protein